MYSETNKVVISWMVPVQRHRLTRLFDRMILTDTCRWRNNSRTDKMCVLQYMMFSQPL